MSFEAAEMEARELIADNALTFSCNRVESNPFMPQDGNDLDHWFCSFSGGRLDEFNFYMSLGSSYEGNEPDPVFALAFVMEDVNAFRGCDGYGDLAKLLGIEDDEDGVNTAAEEIERLGEFVDLLRNPQNVPAAL